MRLQLSIVCLLMFGWLRSNAFHSDSSSVSNHYDSIRNSFLTQLQYCELVNPDDTLQYLKDALSAFVSFDNTVSYNEFFFCFESGYMNLVDTDPKKYPIAQLYLKRDIRWLFLFYLERYILHHNDEKVDKYCRVALIQLKTKKELDLNGADASENLIKIYRKLIRLVHRKNYSKQFRIPGKRSLLEHIGYKFIIQKTSAYEYPSY